MAGQPAENRIFQRTGVDGFQFPSRLAATFFSEMSPAVAIASETEHADKKGPDQAAFIENLSLRGELESATKCLAGSRSRLLLRSSREGPTARNRRPCRQTPPGIFSLATSTLRLLPVRIVHSATCYPVTHTHGEPCPEACDVCLNR